MTSLPAAQVRKMFSGPGSSAEMCIRDSIGVFIPINNNGWIISATSPQYMPSFALNRRVVQLCLLYTSLQIDLIRVTIQGHPLGWRQLLLALVEQGSNHFHRTNLSSLLPYPT